MFELKVDVSNQRRQHWRKITTVHMLVFDAITTMHAKHDEDRSICQEYTSACRPPANSVTPLILQLNQMMPQGVWKRSAHRCVFKACFVFGFDRSLIVPYLYHAEVSFLIHLCFILIHGFQLPPFFEVFCYFERIWHRCPWASNPSSGLNCMLLQLYYLYSISISIFGLWRYLKSTKFFCLAMLS